MNNLEKYRGKHKMTQTELGEAIGISKTGVSQLEKRKLSLKTAKKCAEALNESVFNILGEDNFVVLPKTKEEKEILINIIKEL